MQHLNLFYRTNKMRSPAVVLTICVVLSCCLALGLSAMPLHASCKVDWAFGKPCEMINKVLVGQIQKWAGPTGCAKGGEKCNYKVTSNTGLVLKGTHQTPVKKYQDTFSFTFKPAVNDTSCNVHGESSSDTWYALLDQGTNYCNLHNLVVGAGLDKLSGYSETTSNSVCTQYSSADCEKY